jgi:hypothetical protein
MKQETIEKVKEAIMDEYNMNEVLAAVFARSCLEAVQHTLVRLAEKVTGGKVNE